MEGLLPALWQTAVSGPDAIFSEIIIHFLFLKKLKLDRCPITWRVCRAQLVMVVMGEGGGGLEVRAAGDLGVDGVLALHRAGGELRGGGGRHRGVLRLLQQRVLSLN